MRILPHQWFSAAVLLLLVGAYSTMAIWFPIAYIWSTYEDLYGEWWQTFLFGAAAVLFLRAAKKTENASRWFFVLQALACLYVVLEEISWGQRIIGFRSPEFFRDNNLQNETNLHNLFTGPYSTLLKDSLRYAVAAALIGYGVLLPLFERSKRSFARLLARTGIAPPPLFIAPYFSVAAILELHPFAFNEAEIAELLVGLALACTALYQAGGYRLAGRRADAEALYDQSRRLTGRLAIMIAVCAMAAVSTTSALYASDPHRTQIERRIDNGVERFASRYRRYERWQTVIELYDRLLEQEPDNSFMLRETARAYRRLGNEDAFRRYAAAAIQVELDRYAVEPRRESVLRSLVRGYRLIGDHEQADLYLRRVLDLGLERVERHPESAAAAYSLGRTYSLAGRHRAALEQYGRAQELDPSSARFRDAYDAALARVD